MLLNKCNGRELSGTGSIQWKGNSSSFSRSVQTSFQNKVYVKYVLEQNAIIC